MIEKTKGVHIKQDAINDTVPSLLKGVDSIIFDCDGVLVDITKSYDITIQKTVQYVAKDLGEIHYPIHVDSVIIDQFKATGGFNDEIDLTYAIILSVITADKISKNYRDFILKDLVPNADETGISSVEKFLESTYSDSGISNIIKRLDYPGTRTSNLVCTTFDKFFYGPTFYNKLFPGSNDNGHSIQESIKFSDPGLIENDIIILTEELLDHLLLKFSGRVAIVTGRGKESTRYTLEHLLDKFDLKASIFLEDEPRHMAKPNPLSLANTISKLGAEKTIYVGDSMEDYIMAKKASSEYNKPTVFCGIVGTSKDPQKKLELFAKNGAFIVLDSIHDIPKLLNLGMTSQ